MKCHNATEKQEKRFKMDNKVVKRRCKMDIQRRKEGSGRVKQEGSGWIIQERKECTGWIINQRKNGSG